MKEFVRFRVLRDASTGRPLMLHKPALWDIRVSRFVRRAARNSARRLTKALAQ